MRWFTTGRSFNRLLKKSICFVVFVTRHCGVDVDYASFLASRRTTRAAWRGYPLNPAQKKIIKRYEKKTPGELAHIDLTKLPKDLRTQFRQKESYVAALQDD